MKGGARVRSGPPPNPQALKRDRDHQEWTRLPASGRAGDPPKWPLSIPTKREVALWNREWQRPQAIEWERLGVYIDVALYIRTLVAAERHDAQTQTRTLLRQQMDALGLTIPGLRANRWLIVEEDDAQHDDRSGAESESATPAGIKDRFRVIQGQAAG